MNIKPLSSHKNSEPESGVLYIVGTPIGILMARSERLKNILSPVLDMMQTIPTFVYLIPIIMLLGIGIK